MRPSTNMLGWDNNIPSPSANPPMDGGAPVEEPARPPSIDRRHRTGSLTVLAEEGSSTTPEPDSSTSHRQQTTNPASQPPSSVRTQSPPPQNLSRQPTLSSLDGPAGRSSGNSSGSTLTYDSFWSSHSSSSLNYRSRLPESSSGSFKQPFTTPFTSVQKSNPIIPTLSFPSSPPSSNSLHTAMGSFHHADLALAGQENSPFLPPQP